jgi:hypothetical protein
VKFIESAIGEQGQLLSTRQGQEEQTGRTDGDFRAAPATVSGNKNCRVAMSGGYDRRGIVVYAMQLIQSWLICYRSMMGFCHLRKVGFDVAQGQNGFVSCRIKSSALVPSSLQAPATPDIFIVAPSIVGWLCVCWIYQRYVWRPKLDALYISNVCCANPTTTIKAITRSSLWTWATGKAAVPSGKVAVPAEEVEVLTGPEGVTYQKHATNAYAFAQL